MKPILVLGGTGHFGQRIVSNLIALEQPVRVLSRSAVAARRKLGATVELVEGDVCTPDVLAHALKGAGALVSV